MAKSPLYSATWGRANAWPSGFAARAHRVEEIVNRGTVVRASGPIHVGEAALPIDDEVTAELKGVAGRPLEASALAKEPPVGADGIHAPHSPP
jgi:hypothetical protein